MSRSVSPKRVLIIEFNELTHRLMSQWMDSGELPNFKRFASESTRYITQPDEVQPSLMEPWIQWYSVHSGLPYKEHNVFHLTDGLKAQHESLFSLAAAHGKSVGIFGSMNQKCVESENGFYVSDPWCSVEKAYPPALQTFQSFIAQNVLEHSHPDGNKGSVSHADFLKFMLANGLSSSTLGTILSQLASEKFSDPKNRWKRVEILDRLGLDLFLKLDKKNRPDITAFFSNSTAHLQHTYWRSMEPDAFTVKPSEADLVKYKDAIKFGYTNMDRMLGEIMAQVEPDTLVIFATALGQQPFLRKEAIGGQIFYRLRDPRAFFSIFGIDKFELLPVMTHQYKLLFGDAPAAAAAAEKLRTLTLNGAPLFVAHYKELSNEILVGSLISSEVDDSELIQGGSNGVEFGKHFYLIDGMKSGCHHPEGMLWIRNGTGQDAGQCSILDIMPTVMAALGLQNVIPNDRTGIDLLSQETVAVAA